MIQPLVSIVRDEFHATRRRPSRLLNVFSHKKFLAVLHRTILRVRIGDTWQSKAGLTVRAYKTYQQYLDHQQSKLEHMDLDLQRYDAAYRKALKARLETLPVEWTGLSVLCLAARIGTEVKAFLDVGSFAIGIDLNPGKDNLYVVKGDFHHLQFATHSVDVVFTNSLDHAFDLDRVVAEAKRVLKPNGHLITEVAVGTASGSKPGSYESVFWSSSGDLAGTIASLGFKLVNRTPYRFPEHGEQFLFAVCDKPC